MVSASAEPWRRDDEGVVPAYALTGGRTRPRHRMRLETLVSRGPTPDDQLPPCAPTERQLLELFNTAPLPVAEAASRLQMPVLVTQVLISDLIDSGALSVVAAQDAAVPGVQMLEATLAGLRRKFPKAG
ncbi:DUF742 domain-containing protein [Streptacidiphilus jiangxiensis]|uniref:DUF742 domain-containing protein n=1 Tax=Streptacidiphilus jiangxiensis TaxID=235985 RepID=A0A1H8BQZ9_STRJI|nr:DUF742 domain-containing protein [Streptacidiphilus jiangxiensis]SEM84544.1 Protein of unknown function [Streptacidiphilus jiangxiensis]